MHPVFKKYIIKTSKIRMMKYLNNVSFKTKIIKIIYFHYTGKLILEKIKLNKLQKSNEIIIPKIKNIFNIYFLIFFF